MYNFQINQQVATRNKEVGIIEKCERDEFGNKYLVKIGDRVKWINENHLNESSGINEEYLTEG